MTAMSREDEERILMNRTMAANPGTGAHTSFGLDTWWKKLVLILGIIGIVVLVVAVVGGIISLLAPIFVPLLIVCLIIKLINGRRR